MRKHYDEPILFCKRLCFKAIFKMAYSFFFQENFYSFFGKFLFLYIKLHHFSSLDHSTMPFLSSIRTFPELVLQPSFDPKVTDYYVNVSFDVMLLKVWATVLNCQTEARLDDRFGPSRYITFIFNVLCLWRNPIGAL